MEYENKYYMTPRDFLDSVIYSDQDFKSNMRRRKVSSQELGKMLHNGKFFTKMCSSVDIIIRKYAEILTMIDMTNFVDYILLNTYTGARDWPQNNNDISRERSPDGLWRFHIWDNENSIGLSDDAGFNINIFNHLNLQNLGRIFSPVAPQEILFGAKSII